MDVSEQILLAHRDYGGSDNTDPSGLVSSGSLNYGRGASLGKAVELSVSTIPYTFKFDDTVGLWGAENIFVKINMDIKDTGNLGCVPIDNWDCINLHYVSYPTVNTYVQALSSSDTGNDPGWLPAQLSSKLDDLDRPMVGTLLENLKTNNAYADKWLDIRIYTDQKEEHPYDVIYTPPKYSFYIGFHARNTRRLPYKVDCTVGIAYVGYDELGADKRYIPKELD